MRYKAKIKHSSSFHLGLHLYNNSNGYQLALHYCKIEKKKYNL